MGCPPITPQNQYFLKLLISYIFWLDVYLMLKYLSEKYQPVKIKINNVYDCPTLLKKVLKFIPAQGL